MSIIKAPSQEVLNLLKILGINDKYVTEVFISIKMNEPVMVQITRYMSKDTPLELVTEHFYLSAIPKTEEELRIEELNNQFKKS